ncbi:transposase [Lactiplantibacillus plantarum]|nr:transposase [Lactiplantibacillus plantarum]
MKRYQDDFKASIVKMHREEKSTHETVRCYSHST